ncbi:MAG TPA: DUF4468 domain-containing protein [Flavobacteriaceae bacterium]|nr:DUF4468 domain-containing protein [Flavobacteriaceae bacterium]MCB9212177.1 DUF4468 domain-containing protein [Alteromonas sp.]HPF10445.1 DUF4468 domain-containing protein [Flavobacteriaceae bacterium]HQU21754.1 DUF4468 domain-containing protein [Flavobacteriaceae bacterium]HQU64656.1 DUF4468 domain-containing protein [Flavobacteriaceae bacterium]
MKIIPFLFLAFALYSLPLFAQSEKFGYDINGLQPDYVVVTMEGMSQSVLYQKALQWAQTGNRTVVSSEESNKIIFQGEKENALCYTIVGKKSCNNLRYQVEVAFKDNKYKFEVVGLEQYGPINDTGQKGWFAVELEKAPDAMYTRGGDLKKEYVDTPGNISGLFNSLNEVFKKALLKESEASDDEGW